MKLKEKWQGTVQQLRWRMHHFLLMLANWTRPKVIPDVTKPEIIEGNSLASVLKNVGQTSEEQWQKNQAAIELIRGWLAEEITERESKERELNLERLKETIDNERPPGHKLFSKE